MQRCHGMLQIFGLSQSEWPLQKSQDAPPPNLTWLWFEYGLAQGAGLPLVRMVHARDPWNLERWHGHLRVGKDRFLTALHTDAGDDTLVADIRGALTGLLREIKGAGY